jgi:hypothetical protein
VGQKIQIFPQIAIFTPLQPFHTYSVMKGFSHYTSESWSAKYKRSVDCSHPKGFSQRAHCAGKRKRKLGEGVARHSPRTGRNSTERERLASKLTAFMEAVVARATRLHNTPATTAWVLAERPKVTSSGYGGQGKHPYHAFVPDSTDSEYMYHFKGHYWWSANNSGWWIESSTRIAIRDARQQWDGLEGGAVATGEWRDGSVTLIRPK